jgi:uncharacterized C2H2 Zn-finger protein
MSNKYLQNSQISNKKKHNYVNILCPKCGSNRRIHIHLVREECNLFIVTRECPRCEHIFIEKKVIDKHTNGTGYIYMVFPRIDPHGNIYFRGGQEHVYVWEKSYGRLPKGYIIHHINGDRQDNRLENLVAIPKSSHSPNIQYNQQQSVECPHCGKPVPIGRYLCR